MDFPCMRKTTAYSQNNCIRTWLKLKTMFSGFLTILTKAHQYKVSGHLLQSTSQRMYSFNVTSLFFPQSQLHYMSITLFVSATTVFPMSENATPSIYLFGQNPKLLSLMPTFISEQIQLMASSKYIQVPTGTPITVSHSFCFHCHYNNLLSSGWVLLSLLFFGLVCFSCSPRVSTHQQKWFFEKSDCVTPMFRTAPWFCHYPQSKRWHPHHVPQGPP